MAMNEVTDACKTIRNQIQNNTENPYSSASAYGSSTTYVYFFTKKPAAATLTAAEKWENVSRSTLPLIIDIHLISDQPLNVNKRRELTLLIRCFTQANTTWTFNSETKEAHEISIEKLNEIRYKLETNDTIRTALGNAGLILRRGGIGGIRPLAEDEKTGFGYAFELTMWWETHT